MTRLPQLGMMGVSFNIEDAPKFELAMQLLRESLHETVRDTLFCSDNVVTWNKNLSFLREPQTRSIIDDEAAEGLEKVIIWRTYILLYFAQYASRVSGDFLELGTYAGNTANRITLNIDFQGSNRKYFLYDIFEWKEGDKHHVMEHHKGGNLYQRVADRFADRPYVKVIQGVVPESFGQGFPETVAFAHIDMNNRDPEVAALERILPILSPGGCVVLDDYGWWGYSAQKQALDPVAASHGLQILELPTGQGLILKPF